MLIIYRTFIKWYMCEDNECKFFKLIKKKSRKEDLEMTFSFINLREVWKPSQLVLV